MNKQDGKTPLMWVVTIAVALIIGGVIIAMIFGNTDIVSEIKERFHILQTDGNTQI